MCCDAGKMLRIVEHDNGIACKLGGERRRQSGAARVRVNEQNALAIANRRDCDGQRDRRRTGVGVRRHKENRRRRTFPHLGANAVSKLPQGLAIPSLSRAVWRANGVKKVT